MTLDNYFRKALNNIYNTGVPAYSVPKKPFYFSLPYLGFQSQMIKRQILSLSKFYPQIKFNIIFRNPNTIGSYFKFKDKIPSPLASCVIYKYSCRQCSAAYIGETRKQVRVRICQHKGISHRTGVPLSNPESSKIFNHSINNDHPIHEDQFQILAQCRENDLRILESIYIFDQKPSLNDYASSFDLNILK